MSLLGWEYYRSLEKWITWAEIWIRAESLRVDMVLIGRDTQARAQRPGWEWFIQEIMYVGQADKADSADGILIYKGYWGQTGKPQFHR